MPKATALDDSKPERKGHARLRAQHHSFIINLLLTTLQNEPPRFSSSRDERGNLTLASSAWGPPGDGLGSDILAETQREK